jgi:hypothetical protein
MTIEGYKFITKTLPGRIDTRLIKDYKGKDGWLCEGCKKIVDYLMDPNCDCPEWNETKEKQNLSRKA